MNDSESPYQILLLEDNPRDRDLIDILIGKEGIRYECIWARTKESFEHALRHKPVDIIISDFALPDINGAEALALRLKLAPHIPFIMFSGTIDDNFATETMRKGATDYIIKTTPERLGLAVRRAIDEHVRARHLTHVQDRLQQQEELLQRITHNIDDVIEVLDGDGHRLFTSPSFAKLIDGPLPPFQAPAFPLHHVHPEDRPNLLAVLKRTLAQGASQRLTYRIVRDDGSIRFVESQTTFMAGSTSLAPRVLVVSRDITSRKTHEDLLQHALEEKEALIVEVHHRVKNNLQVIASMLQLQSNKLPDTPSKQAFQECQTRLRTMAMVHEKLYSHDTLSRIDLAGYLRELAAMLKRSYGQPDRPVEVVIRADATLATLATAIQLGLVTHELISNSLKYAFPDVPHPTLIISLARSVTNPLAHLLTVEDNGIGFSIENAKANHSLGLRLVSMFAKQIGARLHAESRPGKTRFCIEFSEPGKTKS